MSPAQAAVAARSAQTWTAPRPVPAVAPPRPRLRVVRAPAHARTRVPFVVLCMAVLAASLLGALLLNTTMATGEYERLALQSRLSTSAQSQQKVEGQLELARSPERLAAAARALGMVPAAPGGYVRLTDSMVLGSPQPAPAGG
jgi:hypothetical protein